jgi:hypothetical protein
VQLFPALKLEAIIRAKIGAPAPPVREVSRIAQQGEENAPGGSRRRICVGREPGARAAVLVVSGIGADAGDYRPAPVSAGHKEPRSAATGAKWPDVHV